MAASKAYADALGIKRKFYLSHLALYTHFLLDLLQSANAADSYCFDILGEARLLTYVFAAVLCVVLPTSAHFLGVIVREEFNKKKELYSP